MRIAFLADSFLLDESVPTNGTQVQLFNLARAFARRGHEVHYLSLTRDRSLVGATPAQIRFHWVERGRDGPLAWWRDVSAFRRILDRIRPDALYQRGRSYLTWIAARWAKENGRAFVWGSNREDSCTFWKVCGRVHRSPRPLWRKSLLYPVAAVQDVLIHRGVRRATGVVNQTRQQAAALERNFRRPGRVLPSYAPAAADAPARAKEKVVLWMASLSPVKQPELFFRLAERCRDLEGWTFVLAGGTRVHAYRRALERIAARLENVRMTGAVPFARTGAHHARAALFVNTSVPGGDGLPNTFVEAWQHGTPVLSLHHDPNGWLGEHGLGTCAHGDREAFLRAGRAFLRGWDGRARPECARFAREVFSAEETIHAYLELFGAA